MIVILLFSACSPALQADSVTNLQVQPSPTVTELAPAAQSTEPAIQTNSAAPVFDVRLSALSSGAKVLRGASEIQVQQAQAEDIRVDDGIEVVKPESQNEQSYSILDFSNALEVELFSSTLVFLNSLKQGAGGSTDVTLHLDRGHLFVHLNEQTDSRVTVQTLSTTIKTLTAGAEFDVCENDQLTCVLVTKGVVEISAKGKKNIVKAGEAGFVPKDEAPSPPICAPLPALIAWEDRFRVFADTPSLVMELSQLKQNPCPVTASGLPFDARILYREEFRHPSSGWARGQIDRFMVRYVRLTSRYYEVQVQGPNDQFLASPPNGRDYGDVNVDVKVFANSASREEFRYGTIFRRSGDQYYAFVISPIHQTWHLLKNSSTGLDVLREGIDTRMRGLESRNVLRVETYGSTFLLFINGRFIEWVSDAEYATGEVGLFVDSMENSDAILHFDSIVVWDVPPLVQGPNQGALENCFNTLDDDDNGLIDRADPDCQRRDSNITPLPPGTSAPAATRTPAPANTARPTTNPPLNTPLPTIPPILPTIIAPLPTLVAPLPTILAPLPTLLLPLPTIQLPLPLRDEPSTPTPGQE